MTININFKKIIAVLVVSTAIYFGYSYRNNLIKLFDHPSEKIVDKAVDYLINDNDSFKRSSLFTSEYINDVLSNYSYYKIYKWTRLYSDINDDNATIEINAITKNKLGVENERKIKLKLKKINNEWLIYDSYNLFVFKMIDEKYDFNYSDNEKHKITSELPVKIKIENWSFSEVFGSSVKGVATISNESKIPVSFVKLEIKYKNNNGEIVNTDETYAIGAEPLFPNDKKTIEWYTTSCYNCYKANVYLNFE